MKDGNSISKKFGFVCFVNPDDAERALSAESLKKEFYVNQALTKEERKLQLER